MSQQTAALLTLVGYKALLIAIGFWAARRVKNEADFFLGGRQVGPVVSGLSYAASTSSAWVLLGFSGFVYGVGLSALWMLPGIWGGYVVVWLVLGPRLQDSSARHGFITLTDYLVDGVSGEAQRLLRVIATLMIFVCFIFYIAAQFDAAAKAFVEQFELGFFESVLIGAVIIIVYAMLGGFWAVSVTDTVQGMVMALIAVGLPVAAMAAAGGPSEVVTTLKATAPPAYLDVTGNRSLLVFLGFVLGVMSVGLGTFGQPHLMARLMAVADDKARRQGFAIAMGWGIVVYLGMAALALAGRALTNGSLGDGEVLFYRLAADVLPPVLGGVVIAAILSAVMSTVDSVLLSAAGAVAHDLGFNRRYPARALLISRIVMALIAIFAVGLTLGLPDSIFNRVLFAWSALGAAFGPLLFARALGRQPSGAARLAAILLGFAVTVFFYVLGTLPGDEGLVALAKLPGDPFERLVPWVLPVLILWGTKKGD